MLVQAGERITQTFSLSETEIVEFARLCGDHNPLHHDPEYASQTRFGGIIACGPHYVSLFMGLLATEFSKRAAMLGLEFSFSLLKAVPPNEPFHMEWEVTGVEFKDSLNGEIVSLKGSIKDNRGVAMLTSTGKVLVTSQL